jgi:uncharacterized protein YbjT (DUF2867 family)
MVVVAVAGGTGHVGRALVDGLLAAGKHSVKVLSRKADEAKSKEIGAPIVPVDYTDVDTIVKVLEENNVHTLISALYMMPDAGGPLEPNLIKAADASKVTKRFIGSDWGFDPVPKEYVLLFSP